ncbi:glycerophosphodiester phosphodiesterase family protein [Mycobacterium sp. NPDC003449]
MHPSTTRHSDHARAAIALAVAVSVSAILMSCGDAPTDAAEGGGVGTDTSKGPLVFAHRGSSKYAPEETIAAFQRAIDDGADTLEGDVAQTKDGELVIIHDDTLSRTTNVEERFPDRAPWNVRDFTLAEIKQLDAGSWFDPAYAAEKIPTLREWIGFTDRRVGLYPEIKNPELYPGIVANVADELRALGYTDEGRAGNGAPAIWMQSAKPAPMQEFHKLLPDVPVAAFGANGVTYTWVTANDRELDEVAHWAGGTLCHPGLSTPAQVSRIQNAGIKCVSEVSDGPNLIDMAVKQGMAVVLTNTPDVAKAVIAGNDPLPNRNGVVVDSVVYNPEGADIALDAGEYVVLRNTSTRPIDISAYTLREYGNAVLHTGDGAVIEPGSYYKIYVGPGTDTATSHFNGRTAEVLNNTLADHIYLYNDDKRVEDIYSYFAS